MMKILQYISLLFKTFLLMACGVSAQQQPKHVSVESEAYEKKLNSLLSFTVPVLDVNEAHKLLNEDAQVFVYDVREPAEYEVSHISGAERITSMSDVTAANHAPSMTDTIIVYCSVGYRSERFGEKLQKAGFSHVYNIYGSLFEWANRGYTLVNSQGTPVKTIHGYSRRWSQWVTHPDLEVTW